MDIRATCHQILAPAQSLALWSHLPPLLLQWRPCCGLYLPTTSKPPGLGEAYPISLTVVGVLLICVVGDIAWVPLDQFVGKGRQTHARLDQDVDEDVVEYGLPPQIVGSVHGHEVLPNPDDFIIEDHQRSDEEALTRHSKPSPLD